MQRPMRWSMSRTKRGHAVTCIYAAIDLSVHPYSSQRTARKGSDTDDTCMCPATLSVWAEIWIGQMHQLRQTQIQELLRSDLPTTPEPGIRGGLESSEIWALGLWRLFGRALSVFTVPWHSWTSTSRDLDPVARLWRLKLRITNLQ